MYFAAASMSATLSFLSLLSLSWAHVVITNPGWRGDNLITNSTFPYGMQWMYPCGGMQVTTNRTYWATTGGTVAFQPAWFVGHQQGILHVNLGIGNDGPLGGPKEIDTQLVTPFGMIGPTNNPYPGTICLPDVKVPDNLHVKAGDNATIQIVLSAQHGAALFSCVDIIFVDVGDPRIPETNATNCFNSTDIGFADIYTHTFKQPNGGFNQGL